MVNSRAPTIVSATNSSTTPQIVIAGDGIMTTDDVNGKGSYVIFNFTSAVPKQIFDTGTWQATQLISLTTIGTYGTLAAGILTMQVNLFSLNGAVIPATLKVVCNIGPANLSNTGLPEGVTVTIPSSSFGPFSPFAGLTVFTTGN